MFFRIVKNDFARKKAVAGIVLIFITMAVILAATSTSIIASLIQSMIQFKKSAVPSDIAQMHSGLYNQMEIDKFTNEQRENIDKQETMTLVNFHGSNIHFSENKTMAETVQDISFVTQNKKFDFILNLNNEKLNVKKDEVAVPIYFMKEYNLKVGDRIRVEGKGYEKEFVISDYARDYQMNSPLTSSKRFVINYNDHYQMIKKQAGELEYLIEFKLKENGDSKAVETAYIEAALPQNGPRISGKIFLIFNAMSDMIIAMVIILISTLLIIISSLCIRLTFLATINEDLREIGVMKAIGISKRDIKKVYLNKYRLMSAGAGTIGYFLSFSVVNLFNGNMKLYISSNLSGNLKYSLSLIPPIIIYLIMVMYCKSVLRKMDNISAVDALRSHMMEGGGEKKYYFSLSNNKFFSINIYMGLRDVWKSLKLYRLLIVIFALCTFIINLTLNMYNTMNSPLFSTYMGIGKCHIRMDFQKKDTLAEDFKHLEKDLKEDLDIEKYAFYTTCSYQVKNELGAWDYINIETGDFNLFPLSYLEGRAPDGESEIALSYANASKDGLNKKIGDEVVVKAQGKEKVMKVCGIYQDITNGGKTAKASRNLGVNNDALLWHIVSIDVAEEVDISRKVNQYRERYDSVQVNDIKEYTKQTLGNIIEQMGMIVIGGIVISLTIAILITSLFIRMLLSKDMRKIAIMRSLGASCKDIKYQYMAGTYVVMILGILIGVLVSSCLGEFLVSMAMSTMGASRIEFVNIPWQTFILCPLAFVIVVGFTISNCFNITVKEDLSMILRS